MQPDQRITLLLSAQRTTKGGRVTHLDLCSGIGGFHIAAEWAGFETVGFSEIDPYCCALLSRHWPQIKNYGDLRRADFSHLRGSITVLSAGVPCQPASLAGKRRGKDDDRWLWPAVLDVVGRVEPAWCLFENPPGILTLDEFGGVLLRLESLGYEVRAFSVPANAVGAKHLRYRVFIVANAGGSAGWQGQQPRGTEAISASETLANRPRELFHWCGNARPGWRDQSADGGEALADADRSKWEAQCESEPIQSQFGSAGRSSGESEWRDFRLTQSPLCGATPRIPDRSHRLKALGNSVVPQQAYPFFEAIMRTELRKAAE